jgi:hypothetical protein
VIIISAYIFTLNRKKILAWEMSGILFIFLFGTLLHFLFELSGGLRFVALIAAVNESVWEHLKIGFWPAFFLAVAEFFVFGKKTGNFLLAKGVSLTLQALLISGIYYGLLSAGAESLAIDILNFFVSIAIAQIVSYNIILVKKRMTLFRAAGMILILLNVVVFSLLTYFPPHSSIFKDPVGGGYGIVVKK